VSRVGDDPAVTLHVYSPPLLRMGAYFVDDDGVLAGRAMSTDEELRAFQSDGGPESLAGHDRFLERAAGGAG
jgi:hypothetical protein